MFLIAVSLIIASAILFLKYVYSHWKRYGIPYIEPVIPFGNLSPVAKRTRSFGLTIYDLYQKTNEPFIGIYLFFRPTILVRDPELVKRVLVTDFVSFHDRGVYCNEDIDPMSGTLFALPGAKWKALRMKLTPTFTSGKLKSIYDVILNVSVKLDEFFEPHANSNNIIDVKDMFSRYTLDVIGSVFFGMELDTINNPDHIFRQMAKRLNNPNRIQSIRVALTFLCPKLLEILHIKGFSTDIQEFMISIVKKTIEYRESNNVSRKDFMQLLLQLRNTGTIQEDGDWNIKPSITKNNIKSMSIEQLAGQVFVFFIAGFETSSATMSYCLHELIKHPQTLKKLQIEIDETLAKCHGEITYESIKSMKYLDLCFKETLRKYPGLPLLNRICTKDYLIPGTDVTIKKGIAVAISLYGIQRDPKYFYEPEKFIPERFLEENKNFNENCYIPFGDGPRICIGIRMGAIITKLGLIRMLSRYNFEALDNKDIEFNEASVTLVPKNGIKLRVSKRVK